MATITVPAGAIQNIRAAINAASSGDLIDLTAVNFNITASGFNTNIPGTSPATFARFGAKALSFQGASQGGTTVSGNPRIFVGQQDARSGVPTDINLKSMTLSYVDASGYILQFGNKIYRSGTDACGNQYFDSINVIPGVDIIDVLFSGTHAGGNGAAGTYMEISSGYSAAGSAPLNFNFSQSVVNLTGQSGFNPADPSGGSSFLQAQGDGITISQSNFNENGYRNSLSIWNSSNILIDRNGFSHPDFPYIRASGETIRNSSGVIFANSFDDGTYLDLRDFCNDTLNINGNNFLMNGVTNPAGLFGGSGPFGILLRDASAFSNSTLTFGTGVTDGNFFEDGLLFKNITSTATSFTGSFFLNVTNPANTGFPISKTFVKASVGGTGSDILTGSTGEDWISGDLGNDTLTGGSGNDAFVFATTLNASTNVDTIADYARGDKIWLDDSIFPSGFGGISQSVVSGNLELSYGGTKFAVLQGVTNNRSSADFIMF
jgi:RTX calcium-binding nonapeptide repeat (4 copies)